MLKEAKLTIGGGLWQVDRRANLTGKEQNYERTTILPTKRMKKKPIERASERPTEQTTYRLPDRPNDQTNDRINERTNLSFNELITCSLKSLELTNKNFPNICN